MTALPPSPFFNSGELQASGVPSYSGSISPAATPGSLTGERTPPPFNSSASVALTLDEAAADVSSQAAAVGICEPTTSTGGVQGSPAPGQELCGAGDLDCIGEIFVGARKLIEPDDRRAEDYVDWDALEEALKEPLPLFIRDDGYLRRQAS